jgi:sugar lactone lactonase YvrE
MKRILTIVALLCLAAPAAAGDRFPETIPLPNGWQPEGIATGKGNTFYSGSRATGAIFKGDLRTGRGDEDFVEPWGGAALGMKVDHRNRLFVAGGGTGTASVYDARTGDLLKRYTLTAAPTFVNDVIVTKRAAYFTDSLKRQLYVLDLGRRGGLPDAARTLTLSGDLLQAPAGGFELNGIEAAKRRLIAVHSALGRLYAIDPRDGDTDQIELEGGDVVNGDGILLHGRRTLYVVQNRNNRIAVVRLDRDLGEGEITGHLTDSDFAVPTTIAEKGGFLWAVNARFTTTPTPDTEYDVVKVRR